jgi:hypothetical protein
MPRLAVQFELEVSSAQKQGQQAGSQFATGFAQGLSSKGKAEAEAFMRGLSASAKASVMAQLGLSSGNVITPPGLAVSASKFQQMLNMGPLKTPMLPTDSTQVMRRINQMVGLNNIQNVATGQARTIYTDFWKQITAGTIKGLRDVTGKDLAKVQGLPDIASYGSGRMKSLLLGLGAAPFSSWIGARLLSDAAFGGKGGGAGGGHGGLLGAGGAGGFAEFFIGIEALKKAFDYGAEKIKQVIDKGFDLYVNASRLHTTVGRFFSTEEAGKQAGLSESQIEQFMLRNQWGRARTSLQNFGVMSSLRGMSKDFQDAYRWAAQIQDRWEYTSRTSYEIHVNIQRMKVDWLTMWNDSGFLKALDSLTGLTDKLLHLMASNGSSIPRTLLAGLFPSLSGFIYQLDPNTGKGPASTNAPLFNLPRALPQMSQFERMGFNIGGVKTTQSLLEKANGYLQEIAQNISNVVKGETGGSSHGLGYPGSSGALHNIP